MLVDGPTTSNWDLLDYSANFSAGFADSLTFHGTDAIRWYAGWNDGIDHASGAYIGGEMIEAAGEIAVTGGGAALRHSVLVLGEGAARRAIGKASRAQARNILQAGPDHAAHHINTLFGHPAIKGGRGPRTSFFPSGGLPQSIHNMPLNLAPVTAGQHAFLHARAYGAELIVFYNTVSPAIASRIVTNIIIGFASPLEAPST